METYYKARKNFSNSLIQKAFLSLGKMGKNNNNRNPSPIRGKTNFFQKIKRKCKKSRG